MRKTKLAWAVAMFLSVCGVVWAGQADTEATAMPAVTTSAEAAIPTGIEDPQEEAELVGDWLPSEDQKGVLRIPPAILFEASPGPQSPARWLPAGLHQSTTFGGEI